jgi:hypothetical protein
MASSVKMIDSVLHSDDAHTLTQLRARFNSFRL